jgi:hypothetical protein
MRGAQPSPASGTLAKTNGVLPKVAGGAPAQEVPMKVEQFFQKWNESGNNDALKSELIDRLISDNALKLECVRKKTDLLSLLYQAFECNTPIVYEKATIVTSDLVDSKWV